MSSDYYGFIAAGEIADAGRQDLADAGRQDLNEQLLSLARLRCYASALVYVEDFDRECRATLNDPLGRAALTLTYQQAQRDGRDRGGQQCCGTTSEWHRPWCETGPRRYYREQGVVVLFDTPDHEDDPDCECDECQVDRDDGDD